MYSYGSPHMAAQKQGDQLERTFSSYVRIQDVVLKTYLGRWTIGRSGARGSGISVLPARYDDDDYFLNVRYDFCVFYNKKASKVGDLSRGWPEGSLLNSYYTEVLRRSLLLSLDCSTLPLIRTLNCCTILKLFGMTRPGIEPRPPGPLANTLPTRPIFSGKCIN